jgi:hypothetical protein
MSWGLRRLIVLHGKMKKGSRLSEVAERREKRTGGGRSGA